jgi:uncharacterized membrane protein
MRALFKRSLVLSILFLQGCALPFSGSASGTADSNKQSSMAADPVLQAQALQIITTRCIACHGPGVQSGGVTNITNIASLIQQGLITPGDSTKGTLISEVQTGSMPPSGAALNGAELGILRDWIESFKTSGKPVPVPSPAPKPTAPPGPISGPISGPTPRPTPVPPVAPGAAKFSVLRATILNRCTRCHGEFNSYATLMAAGVVVRAQPLRSSLYTKTSSGSMPPSASQRLTSTELNYLSSWITAGALNN